MSNWNIVVAERGFVYVGVTSRDGDKVRIDPAYNIRRWSLQTMDGLGGLAERGPGSKENDILDRLTPTRVHIMGVIAEHECTDVAWDKWHARKVK